MRCAKTLGNGCRGPTGRALRQPTPVELVTCEWPPGLRPSWPPYPPARATGAVAATTFSLSAGLPKQHVQTGFENVESGTEPKLRVGINLLPLRKVRLKGRLQTAEAGVFRHVVEDELARLLLDSPLQDGPHHRITPRGAPGRAHDPAVRAVAPTRDRHRFHFNQAQPRLQLSIPCLYAAKELVFVDCLIEVPPSR